VYLDTLNYPESDVICFYPKGKLRLRLMPEFFFKHLHMPT